MNTWNDDDYVAADVESTGIKPEYALQPWRIPRGEVWLTSFAWVWRQDGETLHKGAVYPDYFMIKDFLHWVIREKRTVVGWNLVFDIACLIALGFREEVFQINWLDGMLVWRHLSIEPEYQENARTKKSYSLKIAVPEFRPKYAGYEADIHYHTDDPQELEDLHQYNIQDNGHALWITRHLYLKLKSKQTAAMWLEQRCLPTIADANLRGMLIDTIYSKNLSCLLENTAADRLSKLAPEGMTEKIVRSPQQLRKLLYEDWRLPILFKTVRRDKETQKKIEGDASTNKVALFELSQMDWRPKLVREYREALGNNTKFARRIQESVAYNGDGHSHPQMRVFGTYCVPGDVEVLTRQGWVRLDAWGGGDIVQVQPDLTMKFLPATRFTGPEAHEWVHLKQQGLDCLFTPGHTMPYINLAGQWDTIQAGKMMSRNLFLPIAGVLSTGGMWTPDQMRLFAAVQADGSYVCKRYKDTRYAPTLKFTFKKQRKINRLKALLDRLAVVYREYICEAYPDRTEITIAMSSVPSWCGPDKKVFGPWLLDTSTDGLAAFVAEVEFWDGSSRQDGGFKYGSSILSNTEWVVTIASLVGRKAAIHKTDKSGMTTCHVSDLSIRPVRQSFPRHRNIVTETHQAYCATTQTGFWLARSRGAVFITGNTGRITVSSKQNAIYHYTDPKGRAKQKKVILPIGWASHQTKRGSLFRSQIVAPPGYSIVEFDAAGQEFKWMAIASEDPVMLDLCRPGEDPHAFMAAAIVHGDYRHIQKASKVDGSLEEQQRKGGKVSNLSLQYRTSAAKLMQTARVDYEIYMTKPESEHAWITYQRTYRMIQNYWRNQIAWCRAKGFAETMAGRRVSLKGDWDGPWGWSLQSTSINFPIQGTGGDQKYLALSLLRDKLIEWGGYFILDLHDGLYNILPSDKAKAFAADVGPLLDDLPYGPMWGFIPPIVLNWDCKIGDSWGRLKPFDFNN